MSYLTKRAAGVATVLLAGVFHAVGATFTVTNTADFGAGSLRQAITDANQSTGADTIQFNIPIAGTGVITIAPGNTTTGLPAITGPVTIDGYTQPGSSPNTLAVGNNAVIRIEISGANLTSGHGLVITGSPTTVRGLVINRFPGNGIVLQVVSTSGPGGHTIAGCFIGTNAAGTQALPNGGGIFVNNSPSNTIGGTAAAARNIILGGSNYAIFTPTPAGVNPGDAAGGNTIVNNYIGVNAAGTAALGSTGIFLSNPNNVIGGTAAGSRNVISAAGRYAIQLDEGGADNNTIQGNYIGITADGAASLGAGVGGILIERGESNTIGGTSAAARNVISPGAGTGVNIFGVSGSATTPSGSLARNNSVAGNFIGTNAAGTARLPNTTGSGDGVLIDSGNLNTVSGNVIAGFGNAVAITGGTPVADSNKVQGNFIGTTAAGNAALPNSIGVALTRNAGVTNTLIGGNSAALRNVISGNANFGVAIGNVGANSVQGNYIGVAADGVSALGNGVHGVQIAGNGQAIGGAGTGEGNVIAFNKGDGVRITSGVNNPILGNSIYGNGGLGIDLGGDGVSANDSGDVDQGANTLQNSPLITATSFTAPFYFVSGRLNSAPNANYRVEFFGNDPDNSTAPLQGKTYLGFTTVTTDGSGNGTFDVGLINANAQTLISATATNAALNTSEFSARPLLITSPLAMTTTVADPNIVSPRFVYQFEASGATSLSVGNLPRGLTFDASLRAIHGRPQDVGTFNISLSASNAGGTHNEILVLTVQPAPTSGPVITSTSAVTARTGRAFSFQVITNGGSGNARLSADPLPPGLTVDPVSGVISGTPTVDGSFKVDLQVTDGAAATSATLQITVSSDPARPVIISPKEASTIPGQPFNYQTVAPTSNPTADPVEYRLIGTLPAGLGFDPSSGTIAGTPTVAAMRAASGSTGKPLSGGIITNVQLFASNSRGTGTIPLVFFLTPTGVVNISTRLAVGTDENALIGGFIITGNAPKKLILRAIGPSLKSGDAPLPGALQDPMLELRQGETLLGANDDWRSNQEQEIIDTTVAPSDDRESAAVAILEPNAYTAIVRGKNNTRGIGLVEVFDLGTASLEASSNAKLANISTRGFVQTGDDVMIGGFIVSGGATRVIVRAIGPSLTNAGIGGALQDTTLDFVDGNGSVIVQNDDWRTGGQEQAIKDTTVPPSDDRESAVVANINPGGYTAVVRGKNGSTGVGLVEVYVLQ